MADGEKTLEGVLKTAFRSMLAGVETGLPAVVEAYDHTTQTVKVRPVPRIYFNDGTTERLPTLEGVPVQFPAGQGFAITWPLAAGDTVWLAFSGRAFRAFLSTGNPDGEEAMRGRFSIGDCVAFPQGPHARPHALESASESALVLGEDAPAGARLTIDNGKLTLGTQAIDLLDLVDQLLGALQTALVSTSLGPQPLDPGTQSTLAGIRSALDQIKE